MLASIANFIQKAGWISGLPWGVEVIIPDSFYFASLRDSFANWQAQGFHAASGKPLPEAGNATLFMPAGAKGRAWLITDNFRVIMRYNTSEAYALSVGILAQQIAGEDGIYALAEDFKLLPTTEIEAAQQALTKLGLYQGNVDGRIGPATRDAVHAYQIKGGPKARGQSPHAGFGAEAAEWGGALGARPRSGCAHLSAASASAGKKGFPVGPLRGRATMGTIWKSDISPIADC